MIILCISVYGKDGNLVPRTFFPGLGVGREKALGSAGHVISEHPNFLGVLNYHTLNGTFKMAASSSKPNFLSVLRRIEFSLNNGNFPSLNLKSLQMKCFEYMLEGQDVKCLLVSVGLSETTTVV